MSGSDYLKLGDWNAVCSMCGMKKKAGEMVKNWQGMYRCPEHNEPRHPQDFVRAVPDVQTPPWVQPPADTFRAVCTLNGQCGLPDVGTADCALPDFTASYDPSAPGG